MSRAMLVLLAALIPACADEEPYEIMCGPGEGPPGQFHWMYDTFAPQTLTCTHVDQLWDCSGECCHAIPIATESTPAACAGPCIGLDETSCLASSTCYIARDQAKFYRGAPDSFLGCYATDHLSSTTESCADRRGGAYCTFDGKCAGLYVVTDDVLFAECIDEQLIAGSCTEMATCSMMAPSCPTDHTPGVANGCYTGSCIPNALCAP